MRFELCIRKKGPCCRNWRRRIDGRDHGLVCEIIYVHMLWPSQFLRNRKNDFMFDSRIPNFRYFYLIISKDSHEYYHFTDGGVKLL